MNASGLATPGWTLSFRAHAWLWFIVVVMVGALAWYVYRRTVPPVGEPWRKLLRALRILALAGLLVAAVGPRLDWRGIAERKPRVTVLVDQSESISLTDREGARPVVVKRVLEGPGMGRIRSEATVSWQGFAGGVFSFDPEKLSFTGDATAIGDALLEQRRRMPPPDRVVLITDGINTSGPDPLRAAEDIKLPIYVVGVGDPNPQADVRIVGAAAPELALAGQPMKVTASLENVGLPRRPAKIRVLSRGKVVAEETITLPPPGTRADVELTITPPTPGVMHSTVVLDSIPGEILAQNNTWPLTTRVLKAKRRVLVLAGAPSPDIAFWTRLFHGRDDVDVRLWLAPHPPDRVTQPPALLDSLNEVDLILWHDLPRSALPQERWAAIMTAIHDGGGLLVIPGRNDLPQAWREMLPVEVGVGRYLTRQTQALLAPDAARHPVLATDSDFPDWSLRWNSLPPLLGRVIGLTAQREGTVLLTGEGEPLAVAGLYGKGRIVVFGGLTYWRWDLIPRGLGDPNPAGDAFWSTVVRWLATRQELSRVRVQTDAPAYRLGEPVRIIVQVYDERYTPLDAADVKIDLDEGEVRAVAAPHGEGRYVADISGLSPGEHVAKATATANGINLGSSSAEFSVAAVGLEHEQTRQQKDVLEAVARASRGGYAPPARADSLLGSMPLDMIAEQRERTIAVGSSGWLLWTIIGLLTVEWVGRRVLGLL